MKRSPEERNAIAAEALSRAQSGNSLTNFPAIFAGFGERGIPAADIQPRVNVLTYNAWRAKGRQVRRGEKGVKVITFVPVTDKDTGTVTGKRPWTSTVFHVSQTDAIQ